MTIDFSALSAPFSPDAVSWRVGSTNKDKTKGMALAYLDARDVMCRLDEACGPANWQDRYEFHGARTVCYLSIRVDGEWITKADGAGDSDVEAEKGAISDALKRAAVKWGVGRYLYDMASPWVAIEAFGRSYKIAEGEHTKLRRLLTNDAERPSRQAQQDQREEPKGEPTASAADFAIKGLKAATSADDFKATWETNRANWKAVMSDVDYARVVTIMQSEARRWKDAA
jgi:hypothetical protein